MRILLIISLPLSFDIRSYSAQTKFLTFGSVSERQLPTVFIVRSAGLICFSAPEFKKSWLFSKRYRSSHKFKNDNTEFVLPFKLTILNLSFVKYRLKKTTLTKSPKTPLSFLAGKNDNTDYLLCLETEKLSTRITPYFAALRRQSVLLCATELSTERKASLILRCVPTPRSR